MNLRLAGSHEAAEIAEVWLRSRVASVPEIPPPVHTEEEVQAWFAEVVCPTNEVWVAGVCGTVFGLLVLEDAWIDQLYVDPDHVGRGVGGQLVAVAKRRRPAGLKLWTFQANVRARCFYERHDFVATGTTAGENEEGAPDIRYEWTPPGLGAVPHRREGRGALGS